MGPHKVLERHPNDKYFKIEVNGDSKVVSTELLKPAYFISEELAQFFPEQFLDDYYATQLQSPEHSVPPFIPEDDRIPYDLLLPIHVTKTPNKPINTKTPKPIKKVRFNLPDTANPDIEPEPEPEIPETPETQTIQNQTPIPVPKKVRFVPNILKRSKSITNKPNTQSRQPEPKKKSKFMPNILKRSKPQAKKQLTFINANYKFIITNSHKFYKKY